MSAEVSVIIATYNGADMIGQAIDSVLQQRFTDLELIVVDDGSTDETRAVVERFGDPRLRYIWQPNQERSAARNTGIHASSSQYITFLDADDRYLPDKLARQLPVLRAHEDVGMVLSGWIETDDDGEPLLKQLPWRRCPDPSPKDWFYSQLTCIGANLIRREWLLRVGGFDVELTHAEDTDLWLRLIAAGCKEYWVKDIVMERRRHDANSITDARRMRAGILSVVGKIFADPSLAAALGLTHEEALGRAYLGSAWRQYISGDLENAREDMERALNYHPVLVGYEQLEAQLARRANDPMVDDMVAFTRRVLTNLPQNLANMQLREARVLGKVWAAKAFSAYEVADLATVRRAALRSFLHNPKELLNRGLVTIWLKSLVQQPRPELVSS